MGRTPAWEGAYREFFVARQRSLMRTAYAILGSWPAAEDAVQTSFTQLYVHWPRIQPGAVDAYARRTVVNTCFRMAKVRNRETVTDRLPERPVTAAPTARWRGSTSSPRSGRAVAAGPGGGRPAVPRRPVRRRCGQRPRRRRGHGQEPDRPRPRPPPVGPRRTRVHREEPTMTAEQLVRDQLDRATRDVPGSPDLETAIRHGRRRRRMQRRGGAAIAAVAVLGTRGRRRCGSSTADDRAAGGRRRAGRRSARPGSRAERTRATSLPGTDIDQALVAVVAAHLPSLPAPDDVYPSDSHTAGPMPDADFVKAEDWQAAYTLAGGHEFLLMTALASEGPFSCQGCEHHAVPGGEIYREVSQSLEREVAVRHLVRARRRLDGRRVRVRPRPGRRAGSGRPGALQHRPRGPGADPGLTFAALSASRPDRQVADRRVVRQVQHVQDRVDDGVRVDPVGRVVLLALLLVDLLLHRAWRCGRGRPW